LLNFLTVLSIDLPQSEKAVSDANTKLIKVMVNGCRFPDTYRAVTTDEPAKINAMAKKIFPLLNLITIPPYAKRTLYAKKISNPSGISKSR